jgi:hypothetical protein
LTRAKSGRISFLDVLSAVPPFSEGPLAVYCKFNFNFFFYKNSHTLAATYLYLRPVVRRRLTVVSLYPAYKFPIRPLVNRQVYLPCTKAFNTPFNYPSSKLTSNWSKSGLFRSLLCVLIRGKQKWTANEQEIHFFFGN